MDRIFEETTIYPENISRIDLTDVAGLRRLAGNAATSLSFIGFLSAITLLVYLNDSLPGGFIVVLLCAMLVQGVASSTARRLRSGSIRAAVVAVVWWVIWLGVNLFVIAPRYVDEGLDFTQIIGCVISLTPLLFLGAGLIAIIRYHLAKVNTADSNDLEASPWKEGLGVEMRPSFINKKSIDALYILLLSPLPYLWFYFTQPVNYIDENDISGELGEMTGTLFIALCFIYVCVRIYRRARRAAMLPGSAIVKKDIRPIVLYLRSFQDDNKILMRGRATNGRSLPEKLIRIPFEEIVTDHLWVYGPVLAIGDPRLKGTISLGAARDYADNSDWQNQVIESMKKASMVVAIGGHTPGLAWEINTLIKQDLLWKFVLLFPPVDKHEINVRWQFIATNVPSLGLPSGVDLSYLRAVIFPEGKLTLIFGEENSDWTYEAVLDKSALEIADNRNNENVSSSSPLVKPASKYMSKLSQELLIIARSGLMFLVYGSFLLILFGINTDRVNESLPFIKLSKEREEFVTDVYNKCKKINNNLSNEDSGIFCNCYAKKIADVITYEELKLLSENSSKMQNNNQIEANFTEKTNAIAVACSDVIN